MVSHLVVLLTLAANEPAPCPFEVVRDQTSERPSTLGGRC